MGSPQQPPSAEIATPEELLANAERHYRSPDLNAMRAAVLEAMAALETFVHRKVFSSLKGKLDPLLVHWLESKTRTDFDTRLSVLAPVALGRPIDTRDSLWREYQEARSIRHRVVHAGARVSKERARFVIDTVYKWLAFLSSSVEIQVALLGLKRFFQTRPGLTIANERDAVELIIRYFSKTKAAYVIQEVAGPHRMYRPDVLLKFGEHVVVVETKFFKGGMIGHFVNDVLHQLRNIMSEFRATVGAAVVFASGPADPAYESILELAEGTIYMVVIPI